jgi:hypothetical protein
MCPGPTILWLDDVSTAGHTPDLVGSTETLFGSPVLGKGITRAILDGGVESKQHMLLESL